MHRACHCAEAAEGQAQVFRGQFGQGRFKAAVECGHCRL